MPSLRMVALVSVVLLAAAACNPAGDGEQATDRTGRVVIGMTVSRTGGLTAESTDQFKGLRLWADQVNSQGGIDVGTGDVEGLQVELVSYDDESSKTRVQQLYTRLITQDQADFLISPYSSGLTQAAAVVAEQHQKVMVSTGAASDSIFEQGFTHVAQMYTPASRYLTGSIDLMMAEVPAAERVAIVHEEETFSTDVAEAARNYVEERGLELVLFDRYPTGTSDFGPFINRIQASDPDALVGGGHFEDGTTLVRQLRSKGVDLEFVSILVAPSVPEFSQLGDPAVGIVGPSQWEPEVRFTEKAAEDQGLAWFGPRADEVVQAYEDAYGEEPGYHAMGGYAAGLVLQHAIEQAGSTDAEAVKDVLGDMDAMTFWGRLKFSTDEDSHGLQVGHEMVQIQWQQGPGGKAVREVVWPEEAATATFVEP